MESEILKQGDLIEWDFKDHEHETFFPEVYQAKIAMVDTDNKYYGVYAKYGQDLIPFDKARKVDLEAENKSLREEIDRLKGVIKNAHLAGRNFERSNGMVGEWIQFKEENNI